MYFRLDNIVKYSNLKRMATNLQVPVTAKRIGPSTGDLTRSRVFYLTEEEIKKIEPRVGNKGCVIFLKQNRGKKVELHETALDLKTAFAEGVSTNPYTAGNADLAVSAAGSVLTAATTLSKYLNRITAATATSADSVKLPAPSSRNVCVIINGTSVPIDVFPNGASAFIDSGASGASKVLPAFGRLHFYTPATTGAGASAVWKTATDNGNS